MIEIAIVAAIVTGGALALKLLTGDGEKATDELWTTAARRVGGELEMTDARFLTPRERRIRVTVEGVEISVEAVAERNTRGPENVETRITTAGLTSPYGLRLEVRRRDLLRLLSRKLGIGEHPIGVAEFDEAFHVNGTPRALAIELLDATTRRLVQNAHEGFALRHADLAITRAGAPRAVEPLVAMVRFAIEIVERCADLTRAPRALAAALDLALEERSPRSENGDLRIAKGVVRTRPVTLALRLDDERALTVLSFVDQGQRDWTIERGDVDLEVRSGEPSEAVRGAVGQAAPSLLGVRAIAETIEIAFDGLAPDRDEVKEGLAAVLEALTPLAPYR